MRSASGSVTVMVVVELVVRTRSTMDAVPVGLTVGICEM
jgi:hypothetical protein